MAVRGFQQDIVENWPLGVVTSVLADRLPDGAVAGCKNGQFYNIGPGNAIFGTRKGCAVQNEESLESEVVTQYFLRKTVGDDVHFLVNEDGDLKSLTAGVVGDIDDALFTETEDVFSWQTFDDFAFVVNGTDQFKTDGTDIFRIGILQPDDADWSVAASGSGSDLPAGDYEIVISYYNSDTDHEGPQSEHKSVSVIAGQTITVTLPDASDIDDPQVDFIKIYIKEEGVGNEFFLAVDGTTPAITDTSGWAVGTAAVDLAPSREMLDVFRLLSPGVNNNFPPPEDALFIQNHLFRMFVATADYLYWSPAADPESFNLLDHRLPMSEDGEPVTGLAVLSDALIIFKRNAIYALVGDDPNSWSIVPLDKTVGCVSYPSIGLFDGVLYWMSLRGPQMLKSVDSNVIDITSQLVGPEFAEDVIDPDNLTQSVIIGAPEQHLVAWAVMPSGEDRNSRIIPFNYKLERWMSDEWNIIDVRSCTLVLDANGRAFPMLGDYDGTVYKWGTADADGLPAGTSGSGSVTSATTTTVTDGSQTTWTTDSLVGRYVYVWSNAEGVRNAQRRRITGNTATTLTITPAFSVTPDSAWFYNIGGILFDFQTGFRNGGGPFFKKRIEFAFVELGASSVGINVDLQVYKDFNQQDPVLERTLTLGTGDLWDFGVWDVAKWAAEGADRFRIPIRTAGYSWQLRLIHLSDGEQLFVYRTAVQWLTKSKKTGRDHNR